MTMLDQSLKPVSDDSNNYLIHIVLAEVIVHSGHHKIKDDS